MRKVKLKKQENALDKRLFYLCLGLTLLGLIAVADASAPAAIANFNDKFYYLKQQGIWAVFGISALIIFSKIKYSFWEKAATPFFFASVAALLLVFIPGLGVNLQGARRWIVLGTFSIQPSELLKLSLAVYIAKVATRNKRIVSYFFPIVVSGFLIMLQPDLGTALVITSIGMAQIFISGVSFFYFLSFLAAGFLLVLILIFTSDYRKARLLTFFEQTADPLGKSYHIRQILLALGSGGLFGVGLGQSRQKYLFLPETATDSIFAVIAEEVGFLGAGLIILIFAYFLIICMSIIKNAPDKFSKILAVGLTTWIGSQAFLNIGSMVAVIPLTGVPLPFLSYGGSSLIAILTACGILLNISRYEKTKK